MPPPMKHEARVRYEGKKDEVLTYLRSNPSADYTTESLQREPAFRDVSLESLRAYLRHWTRARALFERRDGRRKSYRANPDYKTISQKREILDAHINSGDSLLQPATTTVNSTAGPFGGAQFTEVNIYEIEQHEDAVRSLCDRTILAGDHLFTDADRRFLERMSKELLRCRYGAEKLAAVERQRRREAAVESAA